MLSCSPTIKMNTKVFIISVIVAICWQFIPATSDCQTTPMSQTTRRHLYTKYAQELVEILSGSKLFDETRLEYLTGYLIGKYEKALVQTIFITAIDESFDVQTPQWLAAALQRIYQPGNVISYEIMVQSQLHLYWKFRDRQDLNELYVFNAAYYFGRITKDALYQQLRNENKRRVEAVLNTVPSSLQHLFSKPYFCLKNKAFPEFIYTTVDIYINDQVKHIFTWRSPSYVDEHGKWVPIFSDASCPKTNGSLLNLKVSLKSLLFGKYLYLEPSAKEFRNIISSWRLDNVPPTSDWSVQLVDNELVFEQNGYLMCATENLYDNERRYVNGLSDKDHTPFTQACQWRAGVCT